MGRFFRTSRVGLMVAVAAIVIAVDVGSIFAADVWPPFAPDPSPGADFRGPGFYMSWLKIVGAWLVFLAWVRSTDWINTDIQELRLPQLDYLRWNPIVFGVFMFAFVLMWLIPYFWISFFLILIAYLTPLTTYVVYRNSLVDNHQRVLTPEHLRFWLATRVNRLGMKVHEEAMDAHAGGPPVKLLGYGGPDAPTNNARLLLARQSPGLLISREIIAEALDSRATAIMLDYTQRSAAINVMIDGVWLPRPARERELADPALESLKTLCGLNPKDRQGLQSGKFASEHESGRFIATLTSQGTPAGERALIQFDDNTIRFRTLDDLGMRVKMQAQLKELLAAPKGMLLFSAMPASGLRNTTDVALHVCDRYVREFVAVEEENAGYQPVENVPITTYKAAEGESPAALFPKLFRSQPNVVVVRDLVNAETVHALCEGTVDKLVFSTVRAKDSVEALMRVLALGVAPAAFADAVIAVVNQRLVRKLCSDCMEAYVPPTQVLQQLGIPEGRIEAFYRPKQPPQEPNSAEPYVPCETCGAVGYLGRTAIFELLVIGDAVRSAMKSRPNLESLRRAARKDGMKSLQEEGILLVAKGVTSLPELMRVLKQ